MCIRDSLRTKGEREGGRKREKERERKGGREREIQGERERERYREREIQAGEGGYGRERGLRVR